MDLFADIYSKRLVNPNDFRLSLRKMDLLEGTIVSGNIFAVSGTGLLGQVSNVVVKLSNSFGGCCAEESVYAASSGTGSFYSFTPAGSGLDALLCGRETANAELGVSFDFSGQTYSMFNLNAFIQGNPDYPHVTEYYPLYGNPSGFLQSGDIDNLATHSDLQATGEILDARLDALEIVSGTFYPASNPSGYTTANSLNATGSNLLGRITSIEGQTGKLADIVYTTGDQEIVGNKVFYNWVFFNEQTFYNGAANFNRNLSLGGTIFEIEDRSNIHDWGSDFGVNLTSGYLARGYGVQSLNWNSRELSGTWNAQGLRVSGNPVLTGTLTGYATQTGLNATGTNLLARITGIEGQTGNFLKAELDAVENLFSGPMMLYPTTAASVSGFATAQAFGGDGTSHTLGLSAFAPSGQFGKLYASPFNAGWGWTSQSNLNRSFYIAFDSVMNSINPGTRADVMIGVSGSSITSAPIPGRGLSLTILNSTSVALGIHNGTGLTTGVFTTQNIVNPGPTVRWVLRWDKPANTLSVYASFMYHHVVSSSFTRPALIGSISGSLGDTYAHGSDVAWLYSTTGTTLQSLVWRVGNMKYHLV